MIALTRVRTLQAIKIKYRGAKKLDSDRKLLFSYRNEILSGQKVVFESAYWKSAKTQLKKESFGKCAYCEANTDVVAHGDVEHFRPKDIYWWLAYTYDNYLFACQICNQSHKGKNFPINGVSFPRPQVLPSTTDRELSDICGNISPDPLLILDNYTLNIYLANHVAEKALLLNPYFDNPATIIAYEFNDDKEEVALVPASLAAKPYIDAMEKYYGINRIELANLRYKTFKLFRILKKAYPCTTGKKLKAEIKAQIDEMLSPSYQFAGMIRYFDLLL